MAKYRPYLTSNSFDASISTSFGFENIELDLNNLGGRIINNSYLYSRPEPYVVRSDITIMPEGTLTIYPNVVMEFAPNVGILVLGTLKAIGAYGNEIIMRPLSSERREVPKAAARVRSLNDVNFSTIRLCKEGNCTSSTNEGTFYRNQKCLKM